MKRLFLLFSLVSVIYLRSAADESNLVSYNCQIESFDELNDIFDQCNVSIDRKVCVGIDFDETLVAKCIALPGGKKVLRLMNGEIKNPEEAAYNEAKKLKEQFGLAEDADLVNEALVRGGYGDLMMNTIALFPDKIEEIAKGSAGAGISPEQYVVAQYIKKSYKQEFIESEDVIKAAVKCLQMKGAFVTIASAGSPSESRSNMACNVGFKFWVAGSSKFANLHGTAQFGTIYNLAIRDESRGAIDTKKLALQTQQEIYGNDPLVDRFETYVLIDNNKRAVAGFLRDAAKLLWDKPTKVIGIHYHSEYNQITAQKLLEEFNDISGKKDSASGWWGYLTGYRN